MNKHMQILYSRILSGHWTVEVKRKIRDQQPNTVVLVIDLKLKSSSVIMSFVAFPHFFKMVTQEDKKLAEAMSREEMSWNESGYAAIL